MKLHEIASAPGNDMNRLYMLKRLILNGEQPEIVDAAYSQGHFSWGDLQKLGFAKKESEPYGGGMTSEWWTYTGPGSIVVVTQATEIKNGEAIHSERKHSLTKGKSTSPVEVDYAERD